MSQMLGNIRGLKWTPEHDATLTQLRKEGYSCAVIARELWGRHRATYSRNAVIGRANRLGLSADHGPKSFKPKRPHRVTPVRSTPFLTTPKFSREETVLRCVEIVSRNLSLMDLEPTDCRYPYGDGPISFCGHPKKDGSSYCAPHHHLVWVKPNPPRHKAFTRAAA